jgi:hypothetical protein
MASLTVLPAAAVAVEADRVATLACHPGLPLVLNVRSPP